MPPLSASVCQPASSILHLPLLLHKRFPMFATVAGLFFLLWEVESAFFVQNDVHQKLATMPSERCRYEICNYSHQRSRFDSSKVCLFAVPKEKGSLSLGSHTRERTVVIMYNKPSNVITSHSNADQISHSANDSGADRRRTVYEDIYSMNGFISDRPGDKNEHTSFEKVTEIKSKLHAVGRLDADTTGLLLLTNDGALVHQTTNPNAKTFDKDSTSNNANPVGKTYEAVIMGHHSLQSTSAQNNTLTSQNANYTYPLQTLLDKGVALSAKHGGHTKPVDALSILSHPSRSTTCVSITISEGKNRQIRRMFHAIGSGVMRLHRVSVGRLSLNGLTDAKKTNQQRRSGDSDIMDEIQEGEWRILTENEIEIGLGWKCRYLDESRNDDHKVEGRSNGRREKKRRKIGRR